MIFICARKAIIQSALTCDVFFYHKGQSKSSTTNNGTSREVPMRLDVMKMSCMANKNSFKGNNEFGIDFSLAFEVFYRRANFFLLIRFELFHCFCVIDKYFSCTLNFF